MFQSREKALGIGFPGASERRKSSHRRAGDSGIASAAQARVPV